MKINPNQIRKVEVYSEKVEYGVLPSSRDNYITRGATNYRKAYLEISLIGRELKYKYFESNEEMERWLEKSIPNFIEL